MKRLFWLLILCPIMGWTQIDFNQYFTQEALRIDFELAGNANQTLAVLQAMKQEPYWGGNPHQTIPAYSMGDYQITVQTLEDKLLFAKGFSSLFREWQTIEEAQHLNRSFHHAIQLPFPKDSVMISLKERQKDGQFKTLLSWKVDPKSYLIAKHKAPQYAVDTINFAGSSANHLDIVFIAEGYTKAQLPKFKKDAKRFAQWIFKVEPFSHYKEKVNLYAVLAPSQETGPDVPGKEIYQNTLLNSSFYTFNAPRYLTVKDTKTMYDVASVVPYDHVYVIVNTDIYGGAGFYNTYTSCAADCPYAEEIASHELAHGLIGLADEYYDNAGDEINYFYTLDIEPWEPNITTLVDFQSKWQHLVKAQTPIPTPRTPNFEDLVGAFEGGAYQSKGIYSPMQDCKMKSNHTKELCPACQEAVTQVMKTYINN